jgi:hypothetical protein
MSAATPSVIEDTNKSSRCRLARLSLQAILQIQDEDEGCIGILNVEVRSTKGNEFPLNKGGKEGEAFWGLSGLVQSTRTDNPQALAPPPLLRGIDFALPHSYFVILTGSSTLSSETTAPPLSLRMRCVRPARSWSCVTTMRVVPKASFNSKRR